MYIQNEARKCCSLRVIIPAGCTLQAVGGAHTAERGQGILLFAASLIKKCLLIFSYNSTKLQLKMEKKTKVAVCICGGAK